MKNLQISTEYFQQGQSLRLSISTNLLYLTMLSRVCDDGGYFNLDTWEISLKTGGRWRPQVILNMLKALARGGLARISTIAGVGQMIGPGQDHLIFEKGESKWDNVEVKWDEV